MDGSLTEAVETTSAEITNACDETPGSGLSVNRRTLFGVGAAGIMGLALTKLSEQPAQAGTTMARNNIAVLPAVPAVQLVSRFMEDRHVQYFVKLFTDMGMQFIPERAKMVLYEDPQATSTGEPAEPGILMILPTFKSFDSSAPSHEAASVVAVMNCGVIGGVFAGHVVVGHNPFQINQFTVLEFDPSKGAVVPKSVTRTQVKGMTAQKIADMLGKPPVDPATSTPMPSITPTNMTFLAGGAFIELLNDAWASPLYPSDGLLNLSKDKSLVNKWSEVQRLRYGGVFAGITVCSSTSSNACTSCSSTITINW